MKENVYKALIDSRGIEATKKKIVSKLVTIAQYMGSPIIGEYNYSSILPDFWEYEIDDPYDANRIQDASDSSNEANLGYSYDSLKYGVNFEILIRTYADKVNIVRASYNGNIVFFEEEGVLKGYAPNYLWEQHMDDLYKRAYVLEQQTITEKQKEDTMDIKKRNKTFFEKLKLIWGL